MKNTPGQRKSTRGRTNLRGRVPGVISEGEFKSHWGLRWLPDDEVSEWATLCQRWSILLKPRLVGRKAWLGVATGKETPGQKAGGLTQASCLLECQQGSPAGVLLKGDRSECHSVSPSQAPLTAVEYQQEKKNVTEPGRERPFPPALSLQLPLLTVFNMEPVDKEKSLQGLNLCTLRRRER